MAMAIALVAASAFPAASATDYSVQGTLQWSAGWARQETREKVFFLCFLALTPVIAASFNFLASRFRFWGMALVAGIIVCFAVFPMCAAKVLATNDSSWLIPLTPVLILLMFGLAAAVIRDVPRIDRIFPKLTEASPCSKRRWPLELTMFLASTFLLFVMIIPAAPVEAAKGIGYDQHIVSFISGPATYQFHGGLIPGRDFFTQYSVGMPALFFPFIGKSAQDLLVNYVWFFSVVVFVYYASLLLLVRWLYGSWLWAISLCTFVYLFQCHFAFPFRDPSSFPLRYPLLPFVSFAVAQAVTARQHWKILAIATGFFLGISVFLNTETGIYMCFATALTGLLPGFHFGRRLLTLLIAAGASVVMFFSACVFFYGPGVFSIDFIAGLVEPLLLYGGGLGACLMTWEFGLPVFANLIAPNVAAATAIWCFTRNEPVNGKHRAALCFLAITGILMTAKYVNMSLLAVWIANSVALLIVIVYWIRTLELRFKSMCGIGYRSAGYALVAICAGLGVFLLLTFNDVRNPTEYSLKSYVGWPSILNEWGGVTRRVGAGFSDAPKEEDIRMIVESTRQDQRVAIYDERDWAYLVAAGRSSAFHFLPALVTFTQGQLTRSLQEPVEIAFVPVELPKSYGVKPEELIPGLWEDFFEVKRTERLRMLCRKPVQSVSE
jgi:hypothetical protein